MSVDPSSVVDLSAIEALRVSKIAIANDLQHIKQLSESGRHYFLTGLAVEASGGMDPAFGEWLRHEVVAAYKIIAAG